MSRHGKGAREDLRVRGHPEEAADAIDEVIDKSREAADELADLERPEGDAGDTAERFAKGFEQELNAS